MRKGNIAALYTVSNADELIFYHL